MAAAKTNEEVNPWDEEYCANDQLIENSWHAIEGMFGKPAR